MKYVLMLVNTQFLAPAFTLKVRHESAIKIEIINNHQYLTMQERHLFIDEEHENGLQIENDWIISSTDNFFYRKKFSKTFGYYKNRI